jgi:hypothetical protein
MTTAFTLCSLIVAFSAIAKPEAKRRPILFYGKDVPKNSLGLTNQQGQLKTSTRAGEITSLKGKELGCLA